jgi:hypothetical protein
MPGCPAHGLSYHDECPPCRLYRDDPRYRAVMDGRHPSRPPRPPETCPHRGGPTGELVPCESCGGRVMLKVYACSAFGKCTVSECRDRRAGVTTAR